MPKSEHKVTKVLFIDMDDTLTNTSGVDVYQINKKLKQGLPVPELFIKDGIDFVIDAIQSDIKVCVTTHAGDGYNKILMKVINSRLKILGLNSIGEKNNQLTIYSKKDLEQSVSRSGRHGEGVVPPNLLELYGKGVSPLMAQESLSALGIKPSADGNLLNIEAITIGDSMGDIAFAGRITELGIPASSIHVRHSEIEDRISRNEQPKYCGLVQPNPSLIEKASQYRGHQQAIERYKNEGQIQTTTTTNFDQIRSVVQAKFGLSMVDSRPKPKSQPKPNKTNSKERLSRLPAAEVGL